MIKIKKEDKEFSHENICIALIATYPKMSKIFMRIAKEAGIQAVNIFASFEEAVEYAREMEPKIDAILSRGGTADYLKKAVSIPVISIPISPFDLIKVIYDHNSTVKEAAFFHFDNMIYNIDDIEKMCNIKIHEYIFRDGEDIHRGVQDAKRKGIQTIIGGDFAVRYAKSLGLSGIQISAGEDAVYRAFQEALQILKERQKEKNKSAQLKVAFGAIAEGVIVSDEGGDIVICNPAAEKMFGVKADRQENLKKRIADIQYRNVFLYKEPEANYIKKVNDSLLAASHRPIFAENEFVGVVSTFEDVTKIQKLEKKIRHEMYTKGLVAKYCLNDIVTEDEEMQNIKRLAETIAKTNSSVLIEGESGTGKELFAQSIHNASERARGPFVAVNCAAIPENLLESELFGYESGAFTGAKKEGKPGLFELAHNGTIFLDEIGELPVTFQTRLLRVLQEKEVMRIGSNRIIPIDIRVIGATNKNLIQKVTEKLFREDLYYRLNVFNLQIPPLRKRKKDICILSKMYMEKNGFAVPEDVFKEMVEGFMNYEWPGNIRELQNMIERICVLFEINREAAQRQLDFLRTEAAMKSGKKVKEDTEKISEDIYNVNINVDKGLKKAVEKIEKEIIEQMLEENEYNQEIVAEKLKIGKTTLWRKIKNDAV